jgi:AraC-like DNA-binding protein
MDELPLSHHVLLRSSNLAETARHIVPEFSVRQLEFATEDRRLDARLHAVRRRRVTPMYLAYGGDIVEVLEEAPYVFVQLLLSGRVLINDDQRDFPSTPEQPSVVSPNGTITLRWHPDATAIVFRIDQKAIENELVDLLCQPIGQPLKFQLAMDLTRAPVRSWVDLAMLFAGELGRADGIATNPVIANDMERILVRGLLLCQPHNYTSKLTDTDVPGYLAAAMGVIEDRTGAALSAGSLARHVGVSTRALQAAFREHLGVTPLQYLRQVRLRRVHEDLLANQRRDGTTVSAVANRWGFSHLGRFAKDYRSRYGETPSQTLRDG